MKLGLYLGWLNLLWIRSCHHGLLWCLSQRTGQKFYQPVTKRTSYRYSSNSILNVLEVFHFNTKILLYTEFLILHISNVFLSPTYSSNEDKASPS